jgi:hypothetical protein
MHAVVHPHTCNSLITSNSYMLSLVCAIHTTEYYLAKNKNKIKKNSFCGDGISSPWMIYRGPGFFATVSFGSTPPPPTLLSCQYKLDQRPTARLRKRDNLLSQEGGRGWARSQIIRPQESLVLYKPFNTLWFVESSDILRQWRLSTRYLTDVRNHNRRGHWDISSEFSIKETVSRLWLGDHLLVSFCRRLPVF